MSSDRRRRFTLRTPFSIFFFLTFLPRYLNTQEVFDSSQDYSSIQSRVYGNRRSLIDTSLPGKGSTVVASPPPSEPVISTDHSPPPPPSPPGPDETPSPPSNSVPSLTVSPPPATPQPPPPSLFLPLSPPPEKKKKSSPNVYLIAGIVVGFTVLGAIIVFFLIFSRKIPIKPWSSTGHLQDSLITEADVPKLQLSELQSACEDFSNIIGSFSDGTIYKGTLSTGAEVAVVSIAASSRAEWSTAMETQFLQKMHKLSKVDHKNFLNVIGYCHEEEQFSRMLVFEYAPNGSLFEHLHSPHAEHLDWPTRLRIVMGIAYCVEHLHNLNPPILHINLDSSSVYLAEDNAAKVSDFSVINSISPSKEGSSSKSLLEPSSLDPQTNLINFGSLLFEIISGKFPDSDSLLLEPKPARDLVDPTLKTFQEDVVERLLEVIRQCMNPYPAQRLTMREIVVKLKEITGIAAEAAVPRASPRWWTELEILSTEGN